MSADGQCYCYQYAHMLSKLSVAGGIDLERPMLSRIRALLPGR